MNRQVFQDILEQIHNQQIRQFTAKCLDDVPDYIEKIPASTTGKYHPFEATKEGGLVWHIRLACWHANTFFNAFQWNGDPKKNIAPDIRTDIILSSLLLHDIGKKADYGKNFWEYKNHPITAGNMIERHKTLLPDKVFTLIKGCVVHHMGPWTPPSILKDITKYNICELIVYQCDYLSSQKTLKVITEIPK